MPLAPPGYLSYYLVGDYLDLSAGPEAQLSGDREGLGRAHIHFVYEGYLVILFSLRVYSQARRSYLAVRRGYQSFIHLTITLPDC